MANDEILPPFNQSLAAILLGAKEAVIAPMRPMLREFDITEPQWRVLRVINDHGAMDATGLAQVGLLHAPSVTRILREMEARGLIVRTGDSRDRRRSMISLSTEGKAVVAGVSAHVRDVMNAYAARFGTERLERLSMELKALCEAIGDL